VRELKIGKLLFKAKAIQLIAFAIFIDGIILGGFIASSILGDKTINIFILMILLFITWVPFFSAISKNVEELT
jgi:hypothetical protein